MSNSNGRLSGSVLQKQLHANETVIQRVDDARVDERCPVFAGPQLVQEIPESGAAGGEAAVTTWELIYRHQVHVIGLNIGVLARAAPQIFGEVHGFTHQITPASAITMSFGI